MKKAIVIGTFPSDKTTEKMLVSCIKSVKALKWDIVLVSHIAIPQEIIQMVDYYIYDKENILEPYELTPFYWYNSPNFSVQIHGNGHIVPITRNMKLSIGMLDMLGYSFFYYTESDNIFSPQDIQTIRNFESSMSISEKEMILFRVGDDPDYVYESLTFGGRPSFFMRNALLPMKTHELLKYSNHHTLESIFYLAFKDIKKDCIIIEKPSSEVFTTSAINVIANHVRVEVIKDHDDDKYFLWASNYSESKEHASMSINGGKDIHLPPGGFFYQQVVLGETLDVEVTDGGRVMVKKFFITEKDLKKFKEKGFIKFNK